MKIAKQKEIVQGVPTVSESQLEAAALEDGQQKDDPTDALPMESV